MKKLKKNKKTIQNNRTNPSESLLANGTTVMLKVESMTGKLESRYHGCYTIKEQTENGNYKLYNSLGNVLEKSYPITKLKP